MALTQVSRGLLSTSIVDNGNATAITIDSSENVGIGTGSPEVTAHVSNAVAAGSDNLALRIQNPTNAADARVGIGFHVNAVAGSGWDGAYIQSANSGSDNGDLRFGSVTNNTLTEAMRIVSGNLLVGKTSVNSGVVGVEAKANGTLVATVAGDTVSLLNRKTNDGEILRLQKDGTTVGSIGTFSGDLFIGNNNSGLRFEYAGLNAVTPFDADSAASSDGVVDLGYSNSRFKDLFLSQSVILGSGYNVSWGGQYSDGKPTIAGGSNGIAFYPTGSTSGEKARLDASGNFGIGLDGGYKLDVLNTVGNVVSSRFTSTATSSTEYGPIIVLTNDPNDTTRYLLAGGSPTVNRFVIYSNGNIKNQNNSYTGISDEKLKENIVDAGSQWDDIKALRVRKYSFKEENASEPTQIGVIAQEVEAAGMSGLVYETADQDTAEDGSFVDTGEVTKTMKYSILYMKAVKALQEAMDRIETLEAKVQQLEN
jgi:hypothetical protein